MLKFIPMIPPLRSGGVLKYLKSAAPDHKKSNKASNYSGCWFSCPKFWGRSWFVL